MNERFNGKVVYQKSYGDWLLVKNKYILPIMHIDFESNKYILKI